MRVYLCAASTDAGYEKARVFAGFLVFAVSSVSALARFGFRAVPTPRDRDARDHTRSAACTISATTQAMPSAHDSERSACLSPR